MAKRKAESDAEAPHRLTVYLSRDTHLALMRRALDETAKAGRRVSATAIVERLIEQYLSRKGA